MLWEVPIMTQIKDTDRILFLDNLRYLMVLLVVVLHAAVSYTKFVPWWCVKDSNSVFFDILLLILDVFLMPVLYFIAGYFAILSFQKKGPRLFLKAKLKRLGLPLLICIPLISPVFPFIYHYTRNNFVLHNSFYPYWINYMKNAGDLYIGVIRSMDQFSHSYLWFISLLLFFFMIFTLYASKKKWYGTKVPPDSTEKIPERSILMIFLAVGSLCTVSAFIATLIFSTPADPEPWVILGNLLQFQPVKVVSYMLYFTMGVYAFHKKWFINTEIPGHPLLWTVVSLLLSFTLLALLKRLMMNPSLLTLFFFTLVRSFLCLSFLAAFTSWALRHWNRPSHFNALLASNSYYIYIIHFLVVIILQLILVGWSGGSIFIKFSIISFASIVISYGISQYAIKPYPRLSLTGIYTLFIIMLIIIRV